MNEIWLAWRLVKWVALMLLGHGVLSALWSGHAERHRAALWWAPLGLLGVSIAGFGLLGIRGETIAEPWVSLSLLASCLSVSGAALHVGRGRSRLGAALALGGLLACVGWMVVREGGLGTGAVLGGLGLLLGGATATRAPGASAGQLERWFFALARAEGLSLLLLMGVAMPLKYVWHIEEATALAGIVHGVLFLLYLGALAVVAAPLQLSWLATGTGVLASSLPLGTFAFEWWFERSRTEVAAG